MLKNSTRLGQLGRQEGRRRDLDHDPADEPLGMGQPVGGQSVLGGRAEQLEEGDVGERRDHRRHDVGCDAGGGGGPGDRAELPDEQVRRAIGQPDRAHAEERIGLGRQVQVGDLLVATDIRQANDDRSLRAEHLEDLAVRRDLVGSRSARAIAP